MQSLGLGESGFYGSNGFPRLLENIFRFFSNFQVIGLIEVNGAAFPFINNLKLTFTLYPISYNLYLLYLLMPNNIQSSALIGNAFVGNKSSFFGKLSLLL